MARLRAPDGCPWDREQTHRTLRPYLIEEAYEVIDAIDADDLDELREEVERQSGASAPELEPVTRVSGRQVFTLVMLVAVVYFLVPQLADLPGIVGEVGGADWIWLVPIIAASTCTYLFATLALMGSVPQHLPAGPTAAAHVGSSFASKVAPAGLGGMALNVRYLQRQGIDSAVATSPPGSYLFK